jgi:elongation factor G
VENIHYCTDVDFTIEVERSLRVLDGVIAIFCAVGGVEPQSETVWHQADKYRVPKLAFVNKMDRIGANYFGAIKMMVDRLGANPLILQIPLGAEDGFIGIIDLIRMKAIAWDEHSLGTEYREITIPKEYMEDAERQRSKLGIGGRTDGALMEKCERRRFPKPAREVIEGNNSCRCSLFAERH